MDKIKLFSVFAVLALLLSVGSGVVLAQDPPPDLSNPQAVGALVEELGKAGDNAGELWSELSPEEQEAVKKYLEPAYAEDTIEETESTRGSSSYELGTTMYNVFDIALWSYSQRISWDYDGSQIVWKARRRYVDIYAPLWFFDGHSGNDEQGGVGETYYYAWTEGHFKECLPGGGGCISHVYPDIWQKVYCNGTYEGWANPW